MNGSLRFPGGLFADFDRLQRQLDELFSPPTGPTSIRALSRGAFPAVNIGSTPDSVEVLAFAPGLDPKQLQVTVDKGLLVIAGERRTEELSGTGAGGAGGAANAAPSDGTASAGARASSTVHAQERFNGSFRRIVSLPDDADPAKVEASYRDGFLRVSVAKRESSKPRQISIQ